MAKKQTRRSISVSRTTYERLKAFCETNNISMSQLVETRVNDFLGDAPVPAMPATPVGPAGMPRPILPRPAMSSAPGKPLESRPGHAPGAPSFVPGAGSASSAAAGASAGAAGQGASPSLSGTSSGASSGTGTAAAHPPAAHPAPMTSAAARFAVDPPPPIIKPRQETAAPKPAEKRPEQIFTF